jgi:UDP-2-acetamido-3-amino-2,3-dideoxy-glucuronate N-acetyltransferase
VGSRERRGIGSVTPRIDPTAEVEPGVEIGSGTSIWGHVHARGPARIGSDCIVGEKTYIAYGVEIGDRVKINAFVYLCNGVVVEDGVMIGAGVIFTNDRYPRATTPDLQTRRDSGPGPDTEPTWVREGATVGAGAVIGPGVEIGRFAMVGMGSAVTRSVPPFHLVIGSPAVGVACVCRCGNPMLRFRAGTVPDAGDVDCKACGSRYKVHAGEVVELGAA